MSARRQMDLAQVAREMGNNTNMEMTFPYCQIENDIYKFLEAASFARMAESQRVWWNKEIDIGGILELDRGPWEDIVGYRENNGMT